MFKFKHIISIIVFLSLVSSYSFHQTKTRLLDYQQSSQSETNKKSDSSSAPESSCCIACLIICLCLGAYMICEMDKREEYKVHTDNIWKFLFIADGGILVLTFINFICHPKKQVIEVTPFVLAVIVFVCGSAYYIFKFTRVCSRNYAEEYFKQEKLCELFKIPCFMWQFIGLTDPCCRQDTYTVSIYADGHTESDYCCVVFWNGFIWIFKRFALLCSTICYYLFVLFYLLFWLLGKVIYNHLYKQNNERPPENKPKDGNDGNDGNKPNGSADDQISYSGGRPPEKPPKDNTPEIKVPNQIPKNEDNLSSKDEMVNNQVENKFSSDVTREVQVVDKYTNKENQ